MNLTWDSTPVLVGLIIAQLYGLRLAAPLLTELGLSLVVALLASVAFAGVLLCTAMLLRNLILIRLLLLPAITVGQFVDGERERQAFCDSFNGNVKRVRIPTTGGAELDATIIRQSGQALEERWIIWFNANGVIYEQVLPFLAEYGRNVDANILAFNFRGVSKSSGYPLRSADLYEDGEAVLNFVLKGGVQLRNILLHGHSLGGAVAAELVRRYPQCSLVSDRSFSSLSVTVQSVTRRGLAPMMGIMLCGAVAFSHLLLSRYAGSNLPDMFQTDISVFTYSLASLLFGYGIGQTDIIPSISPLVIQLFGWEMDAVPAFSADSVRGLVIFHDHDMMIAYHEASIHNHLMKNTIAIPSIRLQSVSSNPHMHSLNTDPREFAHLVQHVRQMLGYQQ